MEFTEPEFMPVERLPCFCRWLGRKLAELRVDQAELCRRTGLSPAHVSRLASGERLPSLSTLTSLAKALGMAPGDVLASCRAEKPIWEG